MKTPTMNKTHISNWRARLSLASARNETGAALIVALLVLLVLATLVPVAMNMTSLDFGRTTAYTKSNDAFYIAEAGIEHGKSLVKAADFNKILYGEDGNIAATGDNGVLSAIGPTVIINTFPHAQASFNGGTYSVRIYDNDDGDGNIYADLDGIVYVSSVGTIDGSTKQINALVRRWVPFIDIPAAVTLVDDEVEIDPSGTLFQIDGNARLPGGADDPSCADKYAVAAGATGADFDDRANPGLESHFTGQGSDPSFSLGDTTYDFARYEAIQTDFLPYATTLASGNIAGPTLGTPSNPGIFHVNGDADISGNVTGAGILMVDGDFRVDGTFYFEGLIIVGACTGCDGRIHGVGNMTLYGAMFVANSASSHSGEARLEIDDNTNIYYSCVALDHIAKALDSTFAVVAWNEVD